MKKLLIIAIVCLLAAGITVGVLAGTGVIYVAQAGEVTRNEARDIALGDVSAELHGVTDLDVDRERKGGEIYYEVEFKLNGVEHKYVLDVNGNILSHRTEADDDYIGGNAGGTTGGTAGGTAGGSSGQSYIGVVAAREAALAAVGLRADAVYAEVELDDYRGQRAYEVEFTHNDYEYEIYVDPFSGEILKSNVPGAEYISIDSAKAAAIAKANELYTLSLDQTNVFELEVQLDTEFIAGAQSTVYKVEFKYAGYEYEFAVDALTGEVVYYERELD